MRQSTVGWLCRHPDKEGKEGHDHRLPSSQTAASSALLHKDLQQANSKHKIVEIQLTSEPFPEFKITTVVSTSTNMALHKIKIVMGENL